VEAGGNLSSEKTVGTVVIGERREIEIEIEIVLYFRAKREREERKVVFSHTHKRLEST